MSRFMGIFFLFAGILFFLSQPLSAEEQTPEAKSPAKAELKDSNQDMESKDKSVAKEQSKPEIKENDKIAIVNQVPIMRSDFDMELMRIQGRMQMQGRPIPPDQMEEFKKNIVENMIGHELLYQECQKQKVTVPANEIENQISEFRGRFKTDEEYKNALAANQLSENTLKDKITRQMTTQKFIETKITDTLKVTDKETKAFYDSHPEYFQQPEKVKASHILVKMKPDADEETKKEAHKKIDAIQAKLKNGDDFAEVAKTDSEGPSNVNGGDLGYFGKGQMVKPFEDAAFAMKPGDVSDVVETRFGLHIIKVVDKKEGEKTPFGEVEDKINDFLMREKTSEKLTSYIEELKKDAKIEIF